MEEKSRRSNIRGMNIRFMNFPVAKICDIIYDQIFLYMSH